jgi:tRNA 2-thiouridine synthesizing protein A
VSEKTLNLRGLKCPLPALRAKKALAGMAAGDLLTLMHRSADRDRYS